MGLLSSHRIFIIGFGKPQNKPPAEVSRGSKNVEMLQSCRLEKLLTFAKD